MQWKQEILHKETMSRKRERERERDREVGKGDSTERRIQVWTVLGLKRLLSFNIGSFCMSLSRMLLHQSLACSQCCPVSYGTTSLPLLWIHVNSDLWSVTWLPLGPNLISLTYTLVLIRKVSLVWEPPDKEIQLMHTLKFSCRRKTLFFISNIPVLLQTD